MNRDEPVVPAQFLMATVLILAALCFAACQPPVPAAEIPGRLEAIGKPDIVLIVIDALRADWTTPYGFEKDTTPELAKWAERGVLFQVDPEDVDPALVAELEGQLPYSLLQALAGDLWRQSLTRFLVEQRREVRAIFVVLPGLAEVSSRYFGGFSAVEFDGETGRPQQNAAQLISFYYTYLDHFLADLWERQSGPKMLAVVSAYGFEAPVGLRKSWARTTGRLLRGQYQRSPDGLFLALGSGLRAGAFLEGARLVDILPTLLYALRFPIARDLDGRVLTGAFETAYLARNPLTFVPSYETIVTQPGIPVRVLPLSE